VRGSHVKTQGKAEEAEKTETSIWTGRGAIGKTRKGVHRGKEKRNRPCDPAVLGAGGVSYTNPSSFHMVIKERVRTGVKRRGG